MKQSLPLYRKIYDDLIEKIENGKLKPGDKIPTEKELSSIYNVSRITSKKAMDLASENNFILRKPGKGSFVSIDTKIKSRKRNINKNPILAIIQPDLSDFFGLLFYKEIEKIAHEKKYVLIHGVSNKCQEKEKELITRYVEFGVDGFILQPVHFETFSNEILKLILDSYPLVLIDRSLKDISCANVVSNNVDAAKEAVDHLFSLGHRKIGVVSRPIDSCSSVMERLKGVQEYFLEKGATFKKNWMLTNLKSLDNQRELTFQEHKMKIKDFLLNNKDLTAILTLEYSPIPIIQIVAQEIGIKIPDDLSLLSFDNPGHLISQVNPVTHIKQDEVEIANRAFSMIEKMINNEKPEMSENVIDTDLVIKGSTCIPRKT